MGFDKSCHSLEFARLDFHASTKAQRTIEEGQVIMWADGGREGFARGGGFTIPAIACLFFSTMQVRTTS